MKMDILAILMVAFCLFAILMFILFYIYAKKYYNEKKISDDYKLESDEVNDDIPKIELIDISINGKNYVFDANNYHLNYNDMVKVMINGFTYNGVVTKGNYMDDLGHYSQIPTKLVLEEENDSEPLNQVEDNYQEINDESDEFIPRKKDETL